MGNEETATLNLNAMNKLFPSLPWSLSFSYGKALQKTCIVTWMGKAENIVAAQTALCNRSKANSEGQRRDAGWSVLNIPEALPGMAFAAMYSYVATASPERQLHSGLVLVM